MIVEECAIYHTTNRDTTFCRDQIVASLPSTPDRHIRRTKLARAVRHKLQLTPRPHVLGSRREISLYQSMEQLRSASSQSGLEIFLFAKFANIHFVIFSYDCGEQEAFLVFLKLSVAEVNLIPLVAIARLFGGILKKKSLNQPNEISECILMS